MMFQELLQVVASFLFDLLVIFFCIFIPSVEKEVIDFEGER